MKCTFPAFAIALVPLLMAQAPQAVTDVASPGLMPVAAEFSRELQTASAETALIAQQAAVIGGVRLDAPVTASAPVRGSYISLDLPAGAKLYPVALERRQAVPAFCSTQTTTTVFNPSRPPLITRACIADTNGDRAFDNIGYMTVNVTMVRPASGLWQPAQPPPQIGGGIVTWLAAPIPSPAPYSPIEDHDIAPVTVEILARPSASFVWVQVTSREGEAHAELSDHREPVRPAEMPFTFAFGGAQIELQSLDEGVLTYRVVSNFPADQLLTFTNTPSPAPPPRRR